MKRLLYTLLYYSGALHVWHWLQRKRVTIVFFHGVLPADRSDLAWVPCRTTLSDEFLDRTFRFLAKHYNFVSLDEAAAMLRGEQPAVRNALAVTIDDG